MFLSEAMHFKSDELELLEDKIEGYILYPFEYIEKDLYGRDYQCDLIFSSQDLEYILTVIEESHELPKLQNDLRDSNRTISQKNREIKKLNKALEQIKSTKPKNDIKNSSLSLIYVLKELLLNPDLNAYYFKGKTQRPNQSGLIAYIEEMKIQGLGKRNMETIFGEANDLHNK